MRQTPRGALIIGLILLHTQIHFTTGELTMRRAVLDRVEGEMAVLLVGEAEERLYIPRSQLPPGSREGDWFQLGEELIPDEAMTQSRRQEMAQRLKRLRETT